MASSDSLLVLPPEVLLFILRKLQLRELKNVMFTCKTLKNLIVNDNKTWRFLCEQKLLVRNSVGNSKPSPSLYQLFRVSYNWRNGIFKRKGLIYHHTNYMPWLIFHNSESILVSVGSQLRCYGTYKNGQPDCANPRWIENVPKIRRHDVRTNDISRFVVKNNYLACGNRDGCVALYKLSHSSGHPNLLAHLKDCHGNGQLEVSAVKLIIKNNLHPIVITGSMSDPVVRFSSIQPGSDPDNYNVKTSEILLLEEKGVKSMDVDFNNERLAVGPCGNSKPLLIDIKTEQIIMSAGQMKNLRTSVRDIQWHDDNTFIYVTHSGTLRIIDVRTQQPVCKLMDPFQSSLYCVKSDGKRAVIVGSAEYSRCVLYDLRNHKQHKQIYFTQKRESPVYSLDFDSTKLIAAVDRSVALLNFNVIPSSVQQHDFSFIFEMINR